MALTFDADGLKAILADSTGFGDDVEFAYGTFRGILSREQRIEGTAAGFEANVWVTPLYVQDTKLPAGVKTDSVLTIGDQDYRVRRINPPDSGGARELLLTEK